MLADEQLDVAIHSARHGKHIKCSNHLVSAARQQCAKHSNDRNVQVACKEPRLHIYYVENFSQQDSHQDSQGPAGDVLLWELELVQGLGLADVFQWMGLVQVLVPAAMNPTQLANQGVTGPICNLPTFPKTFP